MDENTFRNIDVIGTYRVAANETYVTQVTIILLITTLMAIAMAMGINGLKPDF